MGLRRLLAMIVVVDAKLTRSIGRLIRAVVELYGWCVGIDKRCSWNVCAGSVVCVVIVGRYVCNTWNE